MSRKFSEVVFDPALKLDAAPILVEASAGTGKTYSIQNVYLRLILEGRTVQEILVVTFTEAATEDLRKRLRIALTSFRDELEGRDPAPDARDVTEAMAFARAEGTPEDELKRRILRALQDFSQAAIFTIHAFCKRVLEHYAFECGYDPESTLLSETAPLLGDLCRDWWRRHAYGAGHADVPFENVGKLQRFVALRLRRPDAIVIPSPPAAPPRPIPAFNPPNPNGFKPVNALRDLIAETAAGVPPSLTALERERLYSSWIAKCDGAKWNRRNDPVEGRDALREILQENLNAILWARMEVAREIEEKFRAQMREKSAITYDAMLYNVRDVLRRDGGDRLKTRLREEFTAALIDEFQDTDGVQYEIFRMLFQDKPPFVMVGDPKQAIYAFRTGDIFTYFRAREKIAGDCRFTLDKNYRSAPHFVAAVNALFAEDAARPAFKTEHITYEAVEAARTEPLEPEQPLEVWTTEANSPGESEYAAIAAEILRLQKEEQAKPDDFAILVLVHPEAAHAQRELAKHGIYAIRQANGNVFETAEAHALPFLLQALLEPRRMSPLRAALVCGLIPCTAQELFEANHGGVPPSVEKAQNAFMTAAAIWPEAGFLAAFTSLDEKLGIRQHLARQPDAGERLTNLGQLLELLNQAERANQLSPMALVRHLSAQFDPATRTYDEDESLPRISDDSPAVKIMTIFKSKGLEFPYVFLPDLYKRGRLNGLRAGTPLAWSYHNEAGDPLLNFQINDAQAKKQFQEEAWEEDLRLAYVGITRAKLKTYLFALAEEFAGTGDLRLPVAYLLSRLAARAAQNADLPILGKKLEDLPMLGKPSKTDGLPAAATLPDIGKTLVEPEMPFVDATRGHTSFSALMEHGSAEEADHDEAAAEPEEVLLEAVEEEAAAAVETPPAADAIFDIPGGARLGTCWHEIFEKMDFTAPEAEIQRVVDAALDAYRMCPRPNSDMPVERQAVLAAQRDAVHRMVQRVLDLDLPDAGCLRAVPLTARRMEMEFQFSLNQAAGVPLAAVADVLDQHWDTPARNNDFIQRLRKRDGRFPKGFLTGFMDLVFLQGGRFHIVDWKSNRMDGRAADFQWMSGRLREEMKEHGYYLQYLLYLVALHGFLSRSLRGYDYDTHIGGCHYIFLRGPGLHTDRPSAALIHALAALLSPAQ